jgi:hypothetical protein
MKIIFATPKAIAAAIIIQSKLPKPAEKDDNTSSKSK